MSRWFISCIFSSHVLSLSTARFAGSHKREREVSVPVTGEDLEGVDNLDHWNGLVSSPLVKNLWVLSDDNEVVLKRGEVSFILIPLDW